MQSKIDRPKTPVRSACAIVELFEPRRLLSGNVLSKDSAFGSLGQRLNDVFAQYNNYATSPIVGTSVSRAIARANPLIRTQGKSVAIQARATASGAALAGDLARLGASKISQSGQNVSALVPFASLGSIAQLDSLSYARPVYARTSTGSVNAQSDAAIRAINARNTYGATGAGVKIGVLSDSFNTSGDGSYAADVASGDLPNNVQVIEDYTDAVNGTSDEGRAMAQIIYDSAPGASLAFATAFTGQSGFASNIEALRAAGCKVIVDDVFYLDEPFFQDGVIADAIDSVVANGVAYFSAAGNQARQSYDSSWRSATFRAGGSITAVSGLTFWGGTPFDFDSGAGVDDLNSFTLANGASTTITLQWDDPFISAGTTGATKDVDIYILNSAGTQVLAASTDANINGDAVEIVGFQNTSGASATFNVMIVSYEGGVPGRIKYVDFDGQATSIQFGYNSGTVIGHSNSATAAGIAAARYDATPAFGVNPPTSESFSSYGQVPILFDTNGTRLTTAITRQQPMLTGVDGVDTTFFGQGYDATPAPNFFGTSAAAPTVAAVAALLLQKAPTLTPAQIYTAFKTTALDMDDPFTGGFDTGFDFKTGFGLVRADNAMATLTGSVSGKLVQDNNTDGIQNGSDSGIDGATIFVDANSNGTLDIGEFSATTSGGGNYTISGIFPGVVNVRQIIPSGYIATNPSTGVIAVTIAQGATTSNQNFYDFPIVLNGTSGANSYYIRGGSSLTQIWLASSVPPSAANYSIPTSLLTTGLTINGLDGDDQVIADYSLGNPIPSSGLTFNGGNADLGDKIDIRGAGIASNFTLPTAGSVQFGATTINHTGTENVSLSSGTFGVSANLSGVNLSTSGSNSVVNLTTTQTLKNLNITSGAIVRSASSHASALAILADSININSGLLEIALNGNLSGVTQTKSLTITGGGWIELHDNDLIIDYTGQSSPYNAIYNYLKTGLFLLGGTGVGIGSTEVDTQTRPGTLLGIVDNGEVGGQVTSLSGAATPVQSVLVKYTWMGDSNLDGAVDGSDYALIDTGFLSNGTLNTWLFGNYDYAGNTDGSDYALIDTGLTSQSSVL